MITQECAMVHVPVHNPVHGAWALGTGQPD
jgi:hypothetical protein